MSFQEPVNKLEKDIQRLALSYNLPLNLFLFSKYNVRNNRIYPSGKIYHVYAFFFMLFPSVLYIYRMCLVEVTNQNITYIESSLFSFFAVLFGTNILFGFMMMFILDFVHKDNNVLLILKTQTIHRSIEFNTEIRYYIAWNWISTVAIICANIIINVVYYGSFEMYDVATVLDMFSDIIWVAVDINFVIVIRIIILLKQYLDKWINMVLKTNYEYDFDQQCRKLLEIYQNILKAYYLYNRMFQVLVSL